MAAHWNSVARQAGYDPKKFIDAKAGEGFRAVVSLKNMKGAVIGDGTKCSGARCLNENPAIEWCYVGASKAFVAFEDGRRRRFIVNGIPTAQDRTMNVAGEELILRPPSKGQRLGSRQNRRIAGGAKSGTVDGSKSHGRSTASILRNMA